MNRGYPRSALRWEWRRLQLPDGLLYVTRITELFALNVWRNGSYWQWVLASTRQLSDIDRVVIAWGEGPTKMEAQLRAEGWALAHNLEPRQTRLFPPPPLPAPTETPTPAANDEDIPF